ncbi:hypothetical protein MXD62_24645 [Frankia sp. Mgl5]|nr:hypothetical protein [Frankia sp. Mgl5]
MEVGTLMGVPLLDGPDLAFAGPGWYRIRIAARGRDEASGGSESLTGPFFEHDAIAVRRAPRAPAISRERLPSASVASSHPGITGG